MNPAQIDPWRTMRTSEAPGCMCIGIEINVYDAAAHLGHAALANLARSSRNEGTRRCGVELLYRDSLSILGGLQSTGSRRSSPIADHHRLFAFEPQRTEQRAESIGKEFSRHFPNTTSFAATGRSALFAPIFLLTSSKCWILLLPPFAGSSLRMLQLLKLHSSDLITNRG
ncbi:hypothetical protein NL676_032991 [Syzygium grande]|nr:hypothetical protein NL676_032991 [Syzygium grande]